MADADLIILSIGATIGFYMAWNIGANDVANSMATAVGARAITLKQAILFAGVLNVLGAVMVGGHVTSTISKGVVSPTEFHGNEELLMVGMMATLLSAGIWVTLATWKGMPISTTHSIVGSIIGFGLVSLGINGIHWDVLGKVVASWAVSPILGGILSYLLFSLIVKRIFNTENPVWSAVLVSPFLVGATFFIISASVMMKTPLGASTVGSNIVRAIMMSIIIGTIMGGIGFFIIMRKARTVSGYLGVEMIFRKLQILTSCFVAFSHGANDVANAIGPLATLFHVQQGGTVDDSVSVPLYLLILGGFGIMIGIMTWGYRVIKTVAFKITKLTNTRGFSVDFGVATTVLLASKMGMPISTTHTAIGCVVGVGLARGLGGVNLKVIRNIVVSWLITVPIAAITSAGLFVVFRLFI